MIGREIHAVIGVWYREGRTFYVRRSPKMANYPNVWSLLSIQFEPWMIEDPYDFEDVQKLMEQMSEKRLGSVGMRVKRYLTSKTCSDNPMRVPVHLHMYEVELEREPDLNPDYYTDAAWLMPEEYAERSADATCGLCMRMWSDYCVRMGLASAPFAPPVLVHG